MADTAADHPIRGRFITLEGGEGAGKSTLLRNLAERLSDSGQHSVRTREPGGTPLAETIRQIVLHPPHDQKWTPMAEALLMNAARADHVAKLIAPALSRGDWVISDRFSDSTRVYQSIGGGVGAALLQAMEDGVTAKARPDLTIILDADPAQLIKRRDARGAKPDAFESRDISFHADVRAAFLRIAEREPERCIVLDALLPEQALVSVAWANIQERLSGLPVR